MVRLYKKLFGDWTIFETCLFFGSLFLVTILGIIFSGDWLIITCSLIAITTSLLLAKGKIIGQFFGLSLVILYSIISFRQGYFGEIITYLALMLPLYIYGIIQWLRHRDNKTKIVKVNEIKLKEWLGLILVTIVLSICTFFILKAFNTNELLMSTASVVSSILAVYLMARRNKYAFIFYLIDDLTLIILWGIPVFAGGISLIPILMTPVINLINDSYGVYNWHKIKKQQK
ncbi:MAG: nicotinamide riboside transporter PnuC [Clostridia bacterium]|nr:nicotinamide riboside transporter PnuC [Clostridia bacterium]